MLAARIALSRLDYDETVRLLKDVPGTDALGLRGRADWYAGRMEAAADELEAMLQDPEVRDGWARAIAGLARRGVGRKPFQMSGGAVAASDIARLPGAPALVVPLEIDGEEGLAMIATGTAEVALDSTTRKEPSWVSLRFGHKIEVRDVPAVVQDLSAISRQMNAPIKALLGVNLLRHLNVTFDYTGGQFVVRNFVPPVSTHAMRVGLYYAKGGGMLVRSTLQDAKDAPGAVLMVDTAMSFPLALDQDGWKKAGVTLANLQPIADDPKYKKGSVPVLRIGPLELPGVPAVYGTPVDEIEKGLQVDLDGVLGAGLLAAYRVTLADNGKAMLLEDLPMPASPTDGGRGADGAAGAAAPGAQQPPPPGATPSKTAPPKAPASKAAPAPAGGARPNKPATTPKKDHAPE